MYFLNSIPDVVHSIQKAFHKMSNTKRLVIGAIFASLSAIFSAAGGFLPGIGYLISPLATAPILFCSMLSAPIGFFSFLVTNLLLLILQPSELMIFPFTTGLLGFGTGIAFHFFKKRLSIILSGGIVLTAGIFILLYLLKFPILGPAVSKTFSSTTAGLILLFSFFYSWIWVEVGLVLVKRLKTIITS
ncbi:hypothetical protein ACQKP0_19955 [Heyndrickxia sp. NPDC080065]|uniref:hypothetical protein n=1 Tax=Heyndrickxia sp. NPDC080065 TaxID=3390568 RepID=UPI003CFE525F